MYDPYKSPSAQSLDSELPAQFDERLYKYAVTDAPLAIVDPQGAVQSLKLLSAIKASSTVPQYTISS